MTRLALGERKSSGNALGGRAEIDLHRYPWLSHHTLDGRIVMPGAATLVLLEQTASGESLERAHRVWRDLEFTRFLTLPAPPESVCIFTEISNGGTARAFTRIEGPGFTRRCEHVCGLVGSEPCADPRPIESQFDRQRWAQQGPSTQLAPDDYYPAPVSLGPMFHTLRSARDQGDEGAEGELLAPGVGMPHWAWWLDGAFQLAAVWTHRRNGTRTIPLGLEYLERPASPASSKTALVRLVTRGGRFDFLVFARGTMTPLLFGSGLLMGPLPR